VKPASGDRESATTTGSGERRPRPASGERARTAAFFLGEAVVLGV